MPKLLQPTLQQGACFRTSVLVATMALAMFLYLAVYHTCVLVTQTLSVHYKMPAFIHYERPTKQQTFTHSLRSLMLILFIKKKNSKKFMGDQGTENIPADSRP